VTRRSVAVLAAAVLAIVPGAAGCGGDDEPAATTSTPSDAAGPTTGAAPATSPEATEPTVATPTTTTTTPTATTGVPKGGVTQTTPATSTGESGAGGGDEEPARVPVFLTASGATLSPTTVTVPAFLTVEVRIAGRGGATKATISAPGGGAPLDVPAGGTAVRRLTGLKPGDYTVTTSAGGRTTLHVVNGGDPGP
jgi:hypothetical protein